MLINSKNLVIFIDGFAYYFLENSRFLRTFSKKVKEVPGLGYSINIKSELFGGYQPDDIGYFCEWMYDKNSPLKKYAFLFNVLSPISLIGSYYLKRMAHMLVSRIINKNISVIPFEYLRYFSAYDKSPYENGFVFPTVFNKSGSLLKIIYSDFPKSSSRDQEIFRKTKVAINQKTHDNIFVACADLDHINHKYGIGSDMSIEKIKKLDKMLEEVCNLFTEKNPEGNIFILSDHGFVNVKDNVRLGLQNRFGKISESTFIYFVDATLARIWVFDSVLKKEIFEYLDNLWFGRLINEEERKRFGVTDKKLCDYIFLLNEGIVFSDSFVVKKDIKSLHGYHPDLESQKGIFLTNNKNFHERESITALEIFYLLSSVFNYEKNNIY
jgi:predicted AlkP superfamily pyrophosphatase or phosphodiesterase